MTEMDTLPIDCSAPDAEPKMTTPVRTNTEASVISGNLLLSDLLSGSGDVRFQGSCPRCHHWHERAVLRLSRLPQRFNGVRCENCDYKWFGLGGNSTHTSLISQETMSLSQIGSLPHKEDLDGFLDKPHLTSLVEQLHPLSAVASPVATLAVPPNRSRGSSMVSRTSSRRLRRRSSPNSPVRSTKAERSASSIREEFRADFYNPIAAESNRKKRSRPIEIASNLKAKLSDATRRLHLPNISRRRRSRSPQPSLSGAHHAEETDHPQVPGDGEDYQSVSTQPDHSNDQTRLNSFVQPREPQEIQDHSQDHVVVNPLSKPEVTENAASYQAPIKSGEATDPVREGQIKNFRKKWTATVKTAQCTCGDQCHCKRPPSSLIPDNPLSDGASLWHLRENLFPLDLAESIRSRSNSSGPRISFELGHMGGGLPTNPRGSNSSLLSMVSSPARSTRRMTLEPSGRRFSLYESQASTAVSDSNRSNRSSLSARSASLPRPAGLRPASISRGPSPLASPSWAPSYDEGEQSSNRGPSENSAADADNGISIEPSVAGGPLDGVPSPIQEATAPNSERTSMHEIAFVTEPHGHIQIPDAATNRHDNVSIAHIHVDSASSSSSSAHYDNVEEGSATSASEDDGSHYHPNVGSGTFPSFGGPLNSHPIQ